MYCSKCAAQLQDDANFCYKCASPVNVSFNSQNAHARRVEPLSYEEKIRIPPKAPARKTNDASSSFLRFVWVVIVVLCVVVGLNIFLEQQASQEKNRTNSNSRNDSFPSYNPPQPKVTKHALAINAASSAYLTVNLQETKRIAGKFEARGGGRNDIDCYITDRDGVVNLQNGNAPDSYFHSGMKTVGEFDKNLSAGTYYIVFNNPALFYNKAVTLTLTEY